jgi:Gpi18-like mannosyltransferase
MLVKKASLNTFLFILLLFLVSRVGIYITTYFGYNLFSHYDTPPQFFSEQGISKMVLPIFIKDTYKPVLNDLVKFDSPFYLRIAERGYDQYHMDEEHPPADWPFFPLYPLIMRGIHKVLNLNLPLIGFLLSNIFFLGALYVIFLITGEVTGEKKVAEKTILYLLLFPTSIFFSLSIP